jgi:hypothetical protein
MTLLLLTLLAASYEWRDTGTNALELLDDGKPVLTYNYGPQLANNAPERYRRCCYIHPLRAPNGAVVTDDFPRDHYHHRGLAWMWPEVIVDEKKYDMWIPGPLQDRHVRFLDRGPGTLKVENGWFLGDTRVLKEFVELTVKPGPVIELRLRWEAIDRPVMVRGITPDKKGYGGLALRFAPREGTVIRTDVESPAKDSDLKPAAWAEMEAVYQGQRATVRVTQDPKNPGFPSGWCLRHYGFLGVDYPGLTGHTIEPGKPLALHFTVEVK